MILFWELGIVFNTEFFADGSQRTFLINMHRQGEKGVTDTISTIKLLNSGREIQNFLYNDTSEQLFRMNRSYFVIEHDYSYGDQESKSLTTNTFHNISDFIERYNQREEFVYWRNLTREIFFWFKKDAQINLKSLNQLKFKIQYTNGREVELHLNPTPPNSSEEDLRIR